MIRLLFLILIAALSIDIAEPLPLGIPCEDKPWYARNIWDMKLYEDRLYVGCGNSSNTGPAPNAGPMDIWAYREGIGWLTETTIDEEQIDRFVVINDTLVIPGHDALESWEYGNWYVRSTTGEWIRHRNIPSAIHVYDMINYDGLMFAALGARAVTSGESVAISSDAGETWQSKIVPVDANVGYECVPSQTGPVARAYAFLLIGGELFLNTSPRTVTTCNPGYAVAVHYSGQYAVRWDGSEFEDTDLNLFNGIEADRVERVTMYSSKTLYIGATTVNDHQWIPERLFAIDENLQPQLLTPPACTRPQDIDTLDGVLYVLCNEYVSNSWTVSIQTTCDLDRWETLTAGTAPTFARSFALSPSAVYVGLGGDTDAPEDTRAEVGEILKYSIPILPTCSP